MNSRQHSNSARSKTAVIFRSSNQPYEESSRDCGGFEKRSVAYAKAPFTVNFEAGCGFVTVSECGWDYHANGNTPKRMAGIYPMGGQVDHAVSAFLEDVHERGLSDKILLVVTGEMGRTPRLNNNGGRDHYGELTPLLIAGGGLKMGQVVGQSDRNAAKAVGDSYRPAHLLGTILHTLFDVGRLRLEWQVPREIIRFADTAQTIDQLLA